MCERMNGGGVQCVSTVHVLFSKTQELETFHEAFEKRATAVSCIAASARYIKVALLAACQAPCLRPSLVAGLHPYLRTS